MKEIVERMSNKGVIFRKLKEIRPKDIGSRKKVTLYIGVNLEKYYCLVMKISKKSKILTKEALEIIELHKEIERYNDSRIHKKYIFIDADICLKAKERLKNDGWKIES